MRTTPVYPKGVPALLLHNSRRYQVLSFMNGQACEILKKEADSLDRDTPREHSAYPSVFMQDEAASEFLAELETAKACFRDNASVDSLLLSAYDDSMS